ncbi:pali-domain-containing protein [Cladorrhinum samala]|uniref:Pali-domain-containing protein n=1 Tax=Cladorrhinum samala TaxID=585594 RepID=A0AAV9HB97_9PEZI|nr:pali-domain-containing protein [Cladorrhinum samala]
MARTGFFHHFGTFLLFSATILLIIVCISAPVVRNISLLRVDLGPRSGSGDNGIFDDDENTSAYLTFGTFGYCAKGVMGVLNGDRCSKSQIGYSPARLVENYGGLNQYSDAAISSTRSLTKAFVLHPIAAGLNFIAFMLALGAGFVGSLLASLVALLAFLTTAVACIIDFVAFAIVRNKVNDDDRSSIKASYGSAAWCLLAAAICSLLGSAVVFLTCCSGRLRKRREARHGPVVKEGAPIDGYGTPVQRRRRWF